MSAGPVRELVVRDFGGLCLGIALRRLHLAHQLLRSDSHIAVETSEGKQQQA